MSPAKNYEQPYSSQHVINNTTDTLRSENALYLRRFPKILHTLYKKQTPFNPRLIKRKLKRSVAPPDRSPSARAVMSTKSPEVSSVSQPPVAFKTFGGASSSSAQSPAQISTVPSDFEHIFHYSEL